MTDRRWKDCLTPSAQLSIKSHLFKVKRVTRTERASEGKNKNSFITGHTNGVAPHSREAHSPALVELTYNGVIRLPWSLVLHSVIVTELCQGKTTCLPFSCPESSHTDGACFRGKEQNFFTFRSHQRSGSLIRREEHSPPLVELTYISVSPGSWFFTPHL